MYVLLFDDPRWPNEAANEVTVIERIGTLPRPDTGKEAVGELLMGRRDRDENFAEDICAGIERRKDKKRGKWGS